MLINLNCSNSLALILQGIVATTILGGATTVGCTDDRAKDESRPTRPVSLSADVSPRHAELVAGAYTHLASAEREPAKVDAYRILAGQTFEKAYRVYGKKEDAEKAASAYEKIGGEKKCAFVRQAAALRAEAARSFEPIDALRSGECSDPAFSGLFPPLGVGGGSAHIAGVETWPGTMFSRVVIAVDRPFSAQPNVGETALFLPAVRLGKAPSEIRVGGLLESIQFRESPAGTELRWSTRAPKVNKSVFALVDPFRWVIDFSVDPSSERKLRPISKVALDPGHGGSDPGAIGPTGLREKDVTLQIAHLVGPALARQGISVVITRDDDRTMSLEERTARVNASEADLFVSIHCNAAERSDARGVETYTLDTSRDALSSRIAARENATRSDQTSSTELGSILASLRVSGEARSVRLAELLQRAAVASLRPKYADLKDGGVKHAGFYVLVGARMPAVLFETSYISNPLEERLLSVEDYRMRLADSIVNAVLAFREGK